jgi:tetratricopeptide (TPR) repeat protein
MLFDLRSGARRRTVKVVYLGLALLMFVGFVGFGIGSSGLSGSIGDLIRDNGSTTDGANDAVDRLTVQVQNADAKTKANPSDAAAWSELAKARVRLAQVGDNFDTAASNYTAEGRRQLTAAGTAWDKYVALKPSTPDERLIRQMTQAFVSLGQPEKAIGAQEMLTEIQPEANTFSNLAILSYQAGQTRKGDLAAAKAVDLTEDKDEKKSLKEQLDQAKTQAITNQIQQAVTPTPTIG